jgi:quinol monooxygenase YgiN
VVPKRLRLLCGFVTMATILVGARSVSGEGNMEQRLVRIAELEIEPNQLSAYTNALREEINTSIGAEPGVLTLCAVAVKGNPTQIRIFETYANQAAYEWHLQTSHFKKYKTETQGMVKSLKLVETEPIIFGAK